MKKTLILTTALVSFGFAANADVTVMSWGGAYGEAQTEAHVKPWAAATGNAAKQGATWQGSLDTLQLAPTRGSAWALQAPARWHKAQVQRRAALGGHVGVRPVRGGGALRIGTAQRNRIARARRRVVQLHRELCAVPLKAWLGR